MLHKKFIVKSGGLMEENNEFEEILLFSSLNDYQINEVCAILTENNIPFIRKDDGVGSYMNLYMGHSYQEKSVYVSKRDYDKALELIAVFTTNDAEEEKLEEEQENTNDRTSNTLTLISKIAIWTVLILPILLIILMAETFLKFEQVMKKYTENLL